MSVESRIRGGWDGIDILVVSPTPTHPQDHGNRKRAFELCNELKTQGANIHFVHYASELEWHADRPPRAERDMIAAWASYHLIAPTRPLHETARGRDHLIDEWADPALSGYVRWVCSTRKFDAVIVNYTWLSFCFESVPKGVFKILDTNDIFSDRRVMLESGGIAPEFFHTTESEEAKALARADLVWAIKPSEQAHFERLGAGDCITMLHAEPERGWWTAPPSRDGWLRVGVIGARNNVNRRNLELFLDAALPIFESYAAPVKVVIAGGCSQDFEQRTYPNVEIMGRVSDVADFYRDVDAVVAPMQFSTGLKIKVAEAFASGAPLISHLHAMEGFPSQLEAHNLESFERIAIEIVKLAFDPSGLAGLADASHAVCREIQHDVLAALEKTRRRVLRGRKPSVLILATLEDLRRNSLLFDHLCGTLDYMASNANAVLYLVGSVPRTDREAFRANHTAFRVLIEPALARELGDDLPEGWTPSEFEAALETREIEHAYFLCDPTSYISVRSSLLRRAYVRHDAIALAGGDPLNLLEALHPDTNVALVSASTRRLGSLLSRHGVTDVCQVPCLWSGRFGSFERKHLNKPSSAQLLVLGPKDSVAVAALAALAKALKNDVVVADLREARCRGLFARPSGRGATLPIDVLAARLVVDLTDGDELAAAIAEGAQRNGIPVVRPALGAAAVVLQHMSSKWRLATLRQMLDFVARALGDNQFRSAIETDTTANLIALTANGSGWNWLSQDLQTSRRDADRSAADVLFA